MSQVKYRADIDGLRAIAVSIVVAYHALFPGFTGGFVGVDVFFVISGFLITGLLFKEVEKTNSLNFLEFYSKRFKRLYPALVFLILILIVVWGFLFLEVPGNTDLFIKSIRYSIFGFGNIFFKNNTGGYFDLASDEMPLLHFWSLGVEEQFYLVWPLLIFLSSKLAFKKFSLEKKVVTALVTISVLSFVFTEFLISSRLSKEAFYQMHARAWELGIGGLLYFLSKRNSKISSSATDFVSLFGLGLIFTCTYFFGTETRFPGVFAMVPVIGTCLLIFTGGSNNRLIDRFLCNPCVVRLGVLSYGWYLWHWPFLSMLKLYHLGETPSLFWRIVAVILSLVFAQLSLSFIEKPVRFGAKINSFSPKKIIGGSVVLSSLIVLLSLQLRKLEQYVIPPEFAQISKYLNSLETKNYGCLGDEDSAKKKKCIIDFRKNAEDPEVFIWGDSHATAYFALFEELAKQETIRVSLVSNSDMSPLLGVDDVYFMKRNEPKLIGDMNNKIFFNIKKAREKNENVSVVLISRWTKYTGSKPISIKDDTTYLNPDKTIRGSLVELKIGFEKTIKSLKEIGVKKILVFLPTPEFKHKVVNCFKAEMCDTDAHFFESYRSEEVSILQDVASKYDGIQFLDPMQTYCSEENCPQIVTNDIGVKIPVVADDDHVSIESALFLGRREHDKFLWLLDRKPSAVPVK